MFSSSTTAAQALRNIAVYKSATAEQIASDNAGSGVNADMLARFANQLAELEGQYAAVDLWETVLENTDGDKDKARNALTRRLFRGADDSWSGRHNDVRRAAFDGFRDAAETLFAN